MEEQDLNSEVRHKSLSDGGETRSHDRPHSVAIRDSWYGPTWWALAVWNSAFVFNVWSRTQQFGFALPIAPDFKEAATPYAVAAIGGIAGAILLWAVSAGLWFHATRINRSANGWLGRIPPITREFRPSQDSPLNVIICFFLLIVTLIFPLAMRLHFVDKYLSGTSTKLNGSFYANSWQGHLLAMPGEACHNFVYDGKSTAAYCEFFEPWLVVGLAVVSFCTAGVAVKSVIFPFKKTAVSATK